MEKNIKILSENGLHARPAGLFAKQASQFKSTIQVKSAKGTANAKSIMSLMSLGLDQGTEITLVAEGEDADQAISSLEAFLSASSH